MKLCYQVATPDVAVAPSVTAFQGSLAASFSRLGELGYDGVELMTLDPSRLDWQQVKDTAAANGLEPVLVCTGEVYGQLGISFSAPDEAVRRRAVERVCEIIEFAGFLGANVNIGRVRGQYRNGIAHAQTERWAIEAFRRISDHAASRHVAIALESVTLMQINFINTLAEAAAMVDAVGRPNFRLMMDVFHLNIEEKDLFAAIRDYASYNIHVHLADNNRRYPGHCGMDFERVLRTFREVGYDGVFCTEIFQIPDQEQAAAGAIKHLAPLFETIYGRAPR
ncbi:MAG: sugar phosphate isomerase/epimerase family protein [Oscillospiraceae bacterium]